MRIFYLFVVTPTADQECNELIATLARDI